MQLQKKRNQQYVRISGREGAVISAVFLSYSKGNDRLTVSRSLVSVHCYAPVKYLLTPCQGSYELIYLTPLFCIRINGNSSYVFLPLYVLLQVPCFILWMVTVRRMSLDNHPGFDCVKPSCTYFNSFLFFSSHCATIIRGIIACCSVKS